MKILQVNTADLGGGAERVAWNLFRAYRIAGQVSWLAVGAKRSSDPDVFAISNGAGRNLWPRSGVRADTQRQTSKTKSRAVRAIRRLISTIAAPHRTVDKVLGLEDFRYPGTKRLLQLVPGLPDIVHYHNLHGGYFDLRLMPTLSSALPAVVTLHDAWLLSGHCAHSMGCDRWISGCGQCPDLSIYPAVRRDATAHNWQVKRKIYGQSRLYIATPSQWLMEKVKRSMLASAALEMRVIPNGVDVSVFKPADLCSARADLRLPMAAAVVLFVAQRACNNPFKDYAGLRTALDHLSKTRPEAPLICLAIGDDAAAERIGSMEIRHVPYISDPKTLARYYQAADVYIHAAKADTFPNTVLEAQACGVPVVATRIGGIPEQIDDHETGFLVSPGDAVAMANSVEKILVDKARRSQMSTQAAERARRLFSLDRQVAEYIRWYREITERFAKKDHVVSPAQRHTDPVWSNVALDNESIALAHAARKESS